VAALNMIPALLVSLSQVSLVDSLAPPLPSMRILAVKEGMRDLAVYTPLDQSGRRWIKWSHTPRFNPGAAGAWRLAKGELATRSADPSTLPLPDQPGILAGPGNIEGAFRFRLLDSSASLEFSGGVHGGEGVPSRLDFKLDGKTLTFAASPVGTRWEGTKLELATVFERFAVSRWSSVAKVGEDLRIAQKGHPYEAGDRVMITGILPRSLEGPRKVKSVDSSDSYLVEAPNLDETPRPGGERWTWRLMADKGSTGASFSSVWSQTWTSNGYQCQETMTCVSPVIASALMGAMAMGPTSALSGANGGPDGGFASAVIQGQETLRAQGTADVPRFFGPSRSSALTTKGGGFFLAAEALGPSPVVRTQIIDRADGRVKAYHYLLFDPAEKTKISPGAVFSWGVRLRAGILPRP
jgi:hypothetical protein